MRIFLRLLCLFAAISSAGCVAPQAQPARRTEVLSPMEAQLRSFPAKDRVLWQYRFALADIHAGRYGDAKVRLDDAISRISGIIANDAAAQQSRGIFGSESQKTYIGEPYERAMAFLYRGLLYWREGELDNARASFRNAQFIDSAATENAFRGDFVLMEYLDGLATERLAGDGAESLERARKLAKRELPAYGGAGNVLFFVEFGQGPLKYADGDYGEQLKFRPSPSRIRSAELTIEGRKIRLSPWDEVTFQATTRGGRVMDYILGNKAVFKETADAVGDIALAGAAIAADRVHRTDRSDRTDRTDKKPEVVRGQNTRPPPRAARRTSESEARVERSEGSADTAVALGVVGFLGKAVSAATNAEADTRTWDNLPQYLAFTSLQLGPGSYPARLEFLDAQEKIVPELAQSMIVEVPDTGRDTVVILSEHKR